MSFSYFIYCIIITQFSYGRVQEAVHEFLLMGPAVIKDDLSDPTVQVSSKSIYVLYIFLVYAII